MPIFISYSFNAMISQYPPLSGPIRAKILSALNPSIRPLTDFTDISHCSAMEDTLIWGFCLIISRIFSCPFLALFLPLLNDFLKVLVGLSSFRAVLPGSFLTFLKNLRTNSSFHYKGN